jgi:hypothetical protein
VFQTIVVLVIVNTHFFHIFIFYFFLYRHLFKGQFNKRKISKYCFFHMLISIIAVFEYCKLSMYFKKI